MISISETSAGLTIWRRARSLCLLTLMAMPWGLHAEEASICNIAKSAIGEAIHIRGLKTKRSVPCLVHGKEEVKKYLLHAINTKITPEKLKMEELLYRALGFIPDDFRYKEGIIDLYLSQLGGYYDPEKQHFVMAGWMPAMLQNTIAVHELTHALQDQHFNLDTFLDYKGFSGDQLLARSALVEGDATAVMMDYTRKLTGQQSIAKDKDVESIMMQNLVSGAMVSGFSNVPKSLRNLLLFPYTSGLRFAHALLLQGGYQRIDRAFSSPPETSEEILHPEKYLSRGSEEFKTISTSDLAAEMGSESEPLYHDSFGEFGISVLLEMHVPTKAAARAAAGWGGDRVAVFPAAEGDNSSIIWKTHWDSERDAHEFFRVFVAALKKQYGIEDASKNLDERVWQASYNGWNVSVKKDKRFVTWKRISQVS